MDNPMTPPSSAKHSPPSTGLTSGEARSRLEKSGPNAMPDTTLHPLRRALGKYVEAGIIAGLLAFNAALGFFQEGRAQATLAALKSRLALIAAVKRDNAWT